MSKELLAKMVTELETLTILLDIRAKRLRAAAALMNEIEEYLSGANSSPTQTASGAWPDSSGQDDSWTES